MLESHRAGEMAYETAKTKVSCIDRKLLISVEKGADEMEDVEWTGVLIGDGVEGDRLHDIEDLCGGEEDDEKTVDVEIDELLGRDIEGRERGRCVNSMRYEEGHM
ncbi:hypothetical protein Tco_0450312 [Tanacetum coccineum]